MCTTSCGASLVDAVGQIQSMLVGVLYWRWACCLLQEAQSSLEALEKKPKKAAVSPTFLHRRASTARLGNPVPILISLPPVAALIEWPT